VKYRAIPHIDLHPSVLCLGTGAFGSDLAASTAFQLLDTYFEHGGNFIDTARVYGAWVPGGMGLSEKTVGQWLKERGIREKIVLATKGAHPDFANMSLSRLSRQDILVDLDESLRALQTETIDLYWLHRDDPKHPVADILETLDEQVTRGKIRAYGCSNWRVERIAEAAQYATEHSLAGFVGDQCLWSYAEPNREAIEDSTLVAMDAALFDYHRKTGLAAVAYTSQARGFFSKASTNPAGLAERLQKMYANEENTRRLQRIQKVARELSLPIAAVTQAYLTNQPFPTFPIAAYTSVAQLQENLPAGDVELSAATLQYLEKGV
jgi:aryl-alcohol dehydrogenase-like predicted oxidoreductase